MIIKIIDINNNSIKMARIESIREDSDGMIRMYPPRNETTTIHVNGSEILRSERPAFDIRMIKSLEVLA